MQKMLKFKNAKKAQKMPKNDIMLKDAFKMKRNAYIMP